MGFFDGIEDAEVFGSGTYFNPGTYRVQVREVKAMAGQNGKVFIVDTEVVEVIQHLTTPAEKEGDPPLQSNEVGTKPGQVISMKHKSALGNIKQFVGAALGIPSTDKGRCTRAIGSAEAEYVVSPDQPLKGAELLLETFHTIKKDGGRFTKHVWNPLPENIDTTLGA